MAKIAQVAKTIMPDWVYQYFVLFFLSGVLGMLGMIYQNQVVALKDSAVYRAVNDIRLHDIDTRLVRLESINRNKSDGDEVDRPKYIKNNDIDRRKLPRPDKL